MDTIYSSAVLSLFIQFITCSLDIYVLFLHSNPVYKIIQYLLIIEIIVQLIEGSFYLWMINNFKNIQNITPIRYYDWIITTPTMLFTFSIYLLFIKNKEESTESSFYDLVINNLFVFILIFILNIFMLGFGYLVELGKISKQFGTTLGFIFFFLVFYLIYMNFAIYTNVGRIMFWIFSGIWFLYGIASLFSYKNKNISYNILDLFSKNFFGLFLAWVLYNNQLTE